MKIYKITNFALENTRDIVFYLKLKKKIFKQNYIITIKLEYQGAVFAFPIIYCLIKRRRKIDYINFWKRIMEKRTEKFEILKDLGESFDSFSEYERKVNLF